MEILKFYAIAFEAIKIHKCSAPQNDRLNLSFVKDSYVDGGKLARNGRITAIFEVGWGRLPIDDEYVALP